MSRGNAQPVDMTSCPVCDETARRDEKLIDALQQAMFALTAVDGIKQWQVRKVRVQAAIREAMRLMQVRSW